MPFDPPKPPPSPPPAVMAFESAFQERLAQEADILFDNGDYPASVEVLRYRHAMDPGDYEAVTDLGWMLGNLRRDDETESIYRAYATYAVEEVDRLLPMAEYLGRKRRFADQIVWLGPGIKDRAAHPNHWRLLARAYEMLEEYDDSIRVWVDYLKDHKEDLTAEANLRRVREKKAKRS